jgi:hypothetical protein
MQGEFRGDFTRDTYNPSKQFLRVLMQQGRVQLDADWNEQVSILLGYMETLATDLIGPYGGPQNNCGFEIFPATDTAIDNLPITPSEKESLKTQLAALPKDEQPNFLIGVGHYYVHGKLCQSQTYEWYSKQKSHPFSADEDKLENGKTYLVYLDVWERHMTHIEDENEMTPGIREVALGKADTTTRSQLISQVKVKLITVPPDELTGWVKDLKQNPETLIKILKDTNAPSPKNEIRPGTGSLKARSKAPSGADATNPCIISPDSRYRGAENQLYRVEIHTPGQAGTATFKWSRENGSVIFPVQDIRGQSIILEHLGWDDRSSLKSGDWVELVDDQYELRGLANPLLQVDSVDVMEMTVTLKETVNPLGNEQSHRILRRWDQQLKEGTIPITTINEGESEKWIELEEGVEICFTEPAPQTPNFYATGDYWLIPARTATKNIEWTQKRDNQGNLVPDYLPPHGTQHHYAPLWIIAVSEDGNAIDVGNENKNDCRAKFSN